jgi:hypothetical protein
MSQAVQKIKQHPTLPEWGLASLRLNRLAGHAAEANIDISRREAPEIGQAVYRTITQASSHLLIGLDLRGVQLMPSFLWRHIGPLLYNRLLNGELGADKRLLYLTNGDEELVRNLQWAFLDASQEAYHRAGKQSDRAALVPAAPKGYCGVLRRPYEEAFTLVHQHQSLSNEELADQVQRRYSPTNANNYLTALADLGLVYRQVAPRSSGGYASRAYALNVPEEVFDATIALV